MHQLSLTAPTLYEELTVSHITRRLELDGSKLEVFIHGESQSKTRKTPLTWIRRTSSNKDEAGKYLILYLVEQTLFQLFFIHMFLCSYDMISCHKSAIMKKMNCLIVCLQVPVKKRFHLP